MIGSRKVEHVKISLEKNVTSNVKTGFDDITLVHRALPGINMAEISPAVKFFGKKIDAPVVIAGMTGGDEKLKKINENLALAAQELNIPMGVGSQRAALDDSNLAATYSVAREAAPDAFLIANVGAVQISEEGVEAAEKAVEMIDANAVAVHINPLHEAVQPEGNAEFRGALDAIKEACSLKVPVIVKETGAGIAEEEAVLLEKAGVAGIDVGGVGGTSFSAVESYRGGKHGKLFWDWGIPTAVSTIECIEATKVDVISTGGIRNGIDIAKALSLGACACGMALPLLIKADKGAREVVGELTRVIEELKIAMFLSGSINIKELRNADLVITGKTREWLDSRGIDYKKFANR